MNKNGGKGTSIAIVTGQSVVCDIWTGGIYIRKDYRERCRYLLSGKKRNGFANLIQQNKKALNMKRAEKMESCYHLRPQLPEEWEKKKMADKKGYLMTGFCGITTYAGEMSLLLEFMERYGTFDMGILYCPEA